MSEGDFLERVVEDDATRNIAEDAPDADLWGRNFLQEYQRAGNRHSFENDHLHVGFALALLSQAVGDAHFFLGDSKQHTRIHPLIIQGSGTGKDPAFTFAKLVADAAGLKMRDLNDVTEAGLVGTVRDEDTEPGVAKTADIVGFREATNLFRMAKQNHSANLAENINQILDGEEIDRKLASGTVSYTPSCTLVGTTYPPNDLNLEELMANGTLARFFYLFKPKDSEYRWRIGERLIEESIQQSDAKEAHQRMVRLAHTVKAIDVTLDSSTTFNIQPSVKQLGATDRLKAIYDEHQLRTRELVKPAIGRYTTHFLKLSCLMAALDYCSTTVRMGHGELALEILEESWRNLLEFYETVASEQSQSQSGDSERDILKALIRQDGISQSRLAEETNLSKRTVRDRVNDLEEEGLLRTEKEGRKKQYHLVRDDEG